MPSAEVYALSSRGPIFLATDFGLSDGFVGVMKAVILGINPRAQITDLTHGLAPQDVLGAAFVIWTAYRYLPPSSVLVAVVDPGVGSSRRGIAVETPRGVFVGPDNGIFTWAIDELGEMEAGATRAVELADRRFWLSSPSATFHGRDVFAPVAAHLSLGTEVAALGPAVRDLVRIERPRPAAGPDWIEGEVLRIDHFGNLITNLGRADLERLGEVAFEIGGVTIHGLRPFFSAGPGLGAVIGSAGLVEIALTNGSAAAALGGTVGAKVRAIRRQGG